MSKEPQTPEEFESMLDEEIAVSSRFGLPLCILAVSLPDAAYANPESEELRRMLDNLRIADMASVSPSGELTVALPNTSPANASRVAQRLRETAPGVKIREAVHAPGDTPETLVQRAWRDTDG